ncbi:hypothetical protein Leryth_021895 [Lithospermum erythrorhizon]|nr:hypothetical protein Leryth_021895 [Lithospermum erythrorhizon]
MATSVTESIEVIKDFCYAQIYDDQKWTHNMWRRKNIPMNRDSLSSDKLLRAAGLFAGSILLMRNYGDLMSNDKILEM